MTSLKKLSPIGKAKRKFADVSKDAVEPDHPSSSSSTSDSDFESEDSPPRREAETEPDEPVLSHAERRRQKKRKLDSGDAMLVDVSLESQTKSASASSSLKEGKGKKVKRPGEVSEGGDSSPKRQNSVWIGNLAYKTTAVALKKFFEGLEVTRVHMPLKAPPSGTGPKVNSGFAYVDFATSDAKIEAIALSERNLEGRRLLIKDADDFAGRPTPATITTNEDGTTTATVAASMSNPGVLKTRTAQKILAAQKQPQGPTLFFGNLGFEVTEDSIRQLLEAHRKKPVKSPVVNGGDESFPDDEKEDSKSKVTSTGKESKKEDRWIRKIRMGTFEDSGKCKGWAFVDFTSTEHATCALVNPRNHSLDGRKLAVEYASPDAVRRGGGPRGFGERPKPAPGQLTREGERKPNNEEGKLGKERGRVGMLRKGSMKRLKHELDVERPSARKVERPKPGAALALAQRGTAAILPSQGRKITF